MIRAKRALCYNYSAGETKAGIRHETMSDSSSSRLKLKRVFIDNYKCMSNFELRFDDLTALFGPNGCGKSTVFEAIYNLRLFVHPLAEENGDRFDRGVLLFPSWTLPDGSKSREQKFEIEVGEEDAESLVYRLVIEHKDDSVIRDDKPRARVKEESLSADGKPLFQFIGAEVQLFRDDHSEGPVYSLDWSNSAIRSVADRSDNRRLVAFREWLRGVFFLSLQPQKMSAVCEAENSDLRSDGVNFASWYRAALQQNSRQLLRAEGPLIENVLPGFDGLRLEKAGGGRRELFAAFKGKGGKNNRLFDRLSDGQRALIVLYAFILGGDSHRLLLLDEPDNYVTLPEIQPLLAEMKDEAGDEAPQIALSSHHPGAIDFLAGCAVWLGRDSETLTCIRKFKNESSLRDSDVYEREIAPCK